ncbi:unnamed protein product [Brachionus calyciflorus]|uniref:SWIM-type domain-containing protein n=1 Tax=Brachionus calyciflorus TaxID=104777 RepID=A0A814FXE6_9BILA|nr:unnamed protein product [Brachionus calyciflorus]
MFIKSIQEKNLTTFHSMVNDIFSLHRVKYNDDDWKLSTCSCWYCLKHYKCHHQITIAARKKKCSFDAVGLDEPIQADRKKARPKNNLNSLGKQPNETQSVASVPKGIDSDEEDIQPISKLTRLELQATKIQEKEEKLCEKFGSIMMKRKHLSTITLPIYSNLTEDDLLILFNKTNFNQNMVQTNDIAPYQLNHDDFEDLFLSIEEIKEETNQLNNNYSTLNNNQNQMTVMIQNQTKLLNKLFDENKLLKETVGRLEKMISSFIENKSDSKTSPTQKSSQKSSTQNPTHSFSSGYISKFYSPQSSYIATRCPGPNLATITNNPQSYTSSLPRFSQPIRPMSFAESVQRNQANNDQAAQKTGKRYTRPSNLNKQPEQKKLKSIDSFNPGKPNNEIDENNQGYKIAGPKYKKTKQSSTQIYIKNAGQNNKSGLKTCERKLELYLGRINKGESDDNVKKVIENIVNIYSFESVQTIQQKFKSYKFTISLYDKDILKDKSLWPKGTIVASQVLTNQNDEPQFDEMSTESSQSNQISNQQKSV